MGGSLGLALKRRKDVFVSAYARRAATRRQALRRGVADAVWDTPLAAVTGADVVVFCTPILSIPDLLRECLPALKPGCVVTDVGSTKAQLMQTVGRLMRNRAVHFIGSHPMAGSEKTGIAVARADLYEGATVAITASCGTRNRRARARIVRFWQAVGGRAVVLDPLAHDRLVARTSHLPHLMAALLVRSIGRNRPPHLGAFCGPGLRDTTRIASGSPEMWHDIVQTNRWAIGAELRGLRHEMDELLQMLATGDFRAVHKLLARSRELRRRWVRASGNGGASR
jgi:prephenate dehydrogenase